MDYMYTSHLDLNQDNAQALLDIAQCLQVQNVLNVCRSFLKSSTILEQTASMPCNNAFSLQETLTADTNCETCDANLLCTCTTTTQPSKLLDDHHLQGMQPAALPISSGDADKQKRDSSDTNCTDLPFKQPNCYYKLRNFYSKQFYKQNVCPSNERSPELPFAFSASAERSVAENNASCIISPSECILESPYQLPSNFLVQPLNECNEDQDSESAPSQPAEQMRLKKAVPLKKLNFLRSQKSSDLSSLEPKIADEDIARDTESERGSDMQKTNAVAAVSAVAENQEELVSSEGLEQNAELEPSQELSETNDQSQIFLSERQYPCAICGKAFKHPSNLELHIRSHTGTTIELFQVHYNSMM